MFRFRSNYGSLRNLCAAHLLSLAIIFIFPYGGNKPVILLWRLGGHTEMTGSKSLEIRGVTDKEMMVLGQIVFQKGCRSLFCLRQEEMSMSRMDSDTGYLAEHTA